MYGEFDDERNYVLRSIALVICIIRVSMILPAIPEMSPIALAFYKDFAHVFVGGLFGAWWAVKGFNIRKARCGWKISDSNWSEYRNLAVGMTVVEVVCFGISKFQ
jgi:hypothetical protein